MDETTFSGAAKFPLPAIVPSPADDPVRAPVSAETYELPLDPVAALCFCQRRFQEVQAECDENQFVLIEAAFVLGLRLEHDRPALLRFIELPMFEERKYPLKPHHKLKPLLLAVQFVMSAHTEAERKRASWIARALRYLVGEDPQPGDVCAALRKHGMDNLANAHAKSRRQEKTDKTDLLRLSAEATGAVADTLRAVQAGQRIWILAEHVPTKRGCCQLQLIATKPAEPGE